MRIPTIDWPKYLFLLGVIVAGGAILWLLLAALQETV